MVNTSLSERRLPEFQKNGNCDNTTQEAVTGLTGYEELQAMLRVLSDYDNNENNYLHYIH